MPTSGSTDFENSTIEVITDAYQKAGVVRIGGNPTASQTAAGKRELNRMIKSWQTKPGINLWVRTQGSMTIVDGQQVYAMGGSGSPDFAARPLRVEQMNYRYSDGRDLPMTTLSYKGYWELPQKDSEGTPTQFFYDPQTDVGKLYIWPVGTDETATLEFIYHRRIEDVEDNDDDFDFPTEWMDALVFSLGARLAGNSYGHDSSRARSLMAVADVKLNEIIDAGFEPGSIFIEPDFQEWG